MRGFPKERAEGLRIQHELFRQRYAQNVLAGMPLVKAATDAYAMTIAEGQSKPQTLIDNAYRLLQGKVIKKRIRELFDRALTQMDITADWVTAQTKRIATTADNETTQLAALRLLCEIGGYYAPKKIASTSDNRSTITLETLVEASYQLEGQRTE